MNSAAATVAAGTAAIGAVGYLILAAKMLRLSFYRKSVDYALGATCAALVCYAVVIDRSDVFLLGGAGFLAFSYDVRRLDDAEEARRRRAQELNNRNPDRNSDA